MDNPRCIYIYEVIGITYEDHMEKRVVQTIRGPVYIDDECQIVICRDQNSCEYIVEVRY